MPAELADKSRRRALPFSNRIGCIMALLFLRCSAGWTNTGTFARYHQDGSMHVMRLVRGSSYGQSHGKLLSRTTTTTALQANMMSYEDVDALNSFSLTVPAVVALVLLVAANGWISRLMGSDENSSGLGDFLRDGRGYNKSGFSLSDDSERAVSSDPIPWLKLPKLDFVEVAGQDNKLSETEVVARLESLRGAMNEELGKGNVQKAEELGQSLEELLEASGMEFNADDEFSGKRR